MNSRVACVLAASLLASACATTRAATPVERPALEVPPVPPRIVEPAPAAPETSTLEPVSELPPEKPAASVTRTKPPAAREPSRDKPQDPKPTETTPAPVEQPPVAAPNTATQIRTPATVDTAAAEKQVRETLGRAQQRLNSINYQRLNGGGQKAYNEAKDFMERAEAAIKASNFELAKGLASNAEKLANEIPSR